MLNYYYSVLCISLYQNYHWSCAISYSCVLVEQELPTLPEHLSSPPVCHGVPGTRSLVLCVCFVDRCLFFFFWPLCCLFFFDLRILITSLWYLHTLLIRQSGFLNYPWARFCIISISCMMDTELSKPLLISVISCIEIMSNSHRVFTNIPEHMTVL
jgi:hypothetical protein